MKHTLSISVIPPVWAKRPSSLVLNMVALVAICSHAASTCFFSALPLEKKRKKSCDLKSFSSESSSSFPNSNDKKKGIIKEMKCKKNKKNKKKNKKIKDKRNHSYQQSTQGRIQAAFVWIVPQFSIGQRNNEVKWDCPTCEVHVRCMWGTCKSLTERENVHIYGLAKEYRSIFFCTSSHGYPRVPGGAECTPGSGGGSMTHG